MQILSRSMAATIILFLSTGSLFAQLQHSPCPSCEAKPIAVSDFTVSQYGASHSEVNLSDEIPFSTVSCQAGHCGAGHHQSGGCGACGCGAGGSGLNSCGASGCGLDACEASGSACHGLFDNFRLFLGLEGSKQPQELGVNAHFGGRLSANWAIPLMEDSGVGLQAGLAYNHTDNAVQVLERLGIVNSREQVFTTLGLFQRADNGLIWAVAWDHLDEEYYTDFNLDQFRGRIGWQNGAEEFGLRASVSDGNKEMRSVAGVNFNLEPMTQGSVYWNHRWETGADTMVWLGVAESHGERNLAFEALLGLPAQSASGERLVFGAEIHVPLNDNFALFGQGNFVTPADTGTVDSFLGFAYYPGGGAKRARKGYQPVLPVAGSTSFAVNAR